MQTCATNRSSLARTTAESLLILLLIELMLHVRPCAMEMPALLAALLQDGSGSGGGGGGGSSSSNAGMAHHLAYDEFPASAVSGSSSLEAIERRKDMLNDAFNEQEAKKIEALEAMMPPVMATEGAPPPPSPLLEAMSHVIAAKHLMKRHCSIEIVTKIPGSCQTMPHALGSACIAGDYMDVFNMECMKQRN